MIKFGAVAIGAGLILLAVTIPDESISIALNLTGVGLAMAALIAEIAEARRRV